jgi:ABC-2 type transport system permease protein
VRAEPGETGAGAAGVRAAAAAGAASARGTLRAVTELRVRLLWRRLRGRGGVPELVAKIVLYAVALPAAVVFAALVGAGAFRAARLAKGIFVDATVTALFFGVWQTWTAVSLSLAERDALDLRRLLVYPIAPSRLWGFGLAASIVGDPFALFWCVLLAGSLVGAALGRFGAWVLPLALTIALFVLATVALVALLQELLGRFLRRRRSRELAIAAVYVGIGFGLAALSGAGQHGALEVARAIRRLRWAFYPAAFASEAGVHLFRDELAAAVPWIAGLAALALATAWAAYRLALAAARSGGEASGGAPDPGRGWRLPGVRGALLEKDAKVLLRHPLASVLALVLPGLSALVAWKLVPRIPEEAGEVVRAIPLLAFVLYTHLATQPFWLNAFGWERGGMRTYLLAPISGADALAAKNAAAYVFSLAVFVACAGAGIAVGGPPPLWAILAALALHAGLAPWLFAAGNLVSILNPRAAPLNLHRGGALSALSGFLGMAILSAAAGLFSLPVLVALRLDAPWGLAGGWAALGAAGLVLYRWSLPREGALVARRREALLAAVCGDEL